MTKLQARGILLGLVTFAVALGFLLHIGPSPHGGAILSHSHFAHRHLLIWEELDFLALLGVIFGILGGILLALIALGTLIGAAFDD